MLDPRATTEGGKTQQQVMHSPVPSTSSPPSPADAHCTVVQAGELPKWYCDGCLVQPGFAPRQA